MEGRQQGCEAEGRGSKHDNMVLLSGFTGNSPWDFPGGSDGKASVYSVRDLGVIPGLGRFPGEGNGNTLQYFCLGVLWHSMQMLPHLMSLSPYSKEYRDVSSFP